MTQEEFNSLRVGDLVREQGDSTDFGEVTEVDHTINKIFVTWADGEKTCESYDVIDLD